MARRGRPTAQIVLSDDERETLQRWARRPKSAQALALRSKIVLAAADGETNQAIAAELRCHPTTVGKWRTRFAEKRLDGLLDEPRPGQPRKITDEVVEAVIVATLETTPPDGSTHWSTRSMAAKVGLNQTVAVEVVTIGVAKIFRSEIKGVSDLRRRGVRVLAPDQCRRT